jgi:hypothetical protein
MHDSCNAASGAGCLTALALTINDERRSLRFLYFSAHVRVAIEADAVNQSERSFLWNLYRPTRKYSQI